MSETSINIFIEELLQFCLQRRSIEWIPEPRKPESFAVFFSENIGIAVINTSEEFLLQVQGHKARISKDLCLYNFQKPKTLYVKLVESADDIYASGDVIENTYILLSVMVEVCAECCRSGYKEFVQGFIPCVTDMKMPNEFVPDYGAFLLYGISHPEPPEEYGAFLLHAFSHPEPSEN